MAQYEKLINLSLLNQFLTKAKTIFAPKITASGILKGDGNGGVSAATAGTDYTTPALVKISDTQPIETENKLWVDTDAGSGNSYQVPTVAESLAMGVSDAKVGDLVRVNSVDANGKPTSWKHVPLNEIKCNKNLLDNWYFAGGGSQLGDGVFPINQRGQTTYSSAEHTIDRWKILSTKLTLTLLADGVTCANIHETNSRVLEQFLPNKNLIYGKEITASILLTNGVLYKGTVTAPNGQPDSEDGILFVSFAGGTLRLKPYATKPWSLWLSVNASASVNVAAIKLELGSEQTLCHNEGTEENPVWVLNEVPDFGEELRKCQRYLIAFKTSSNTRSFLAIGIADSASQYRAVLPTPVTMNHGTNRPVELTGTVTAGSLTASSVASYWEENPGSIALFINVTGATVGDVTKIMLESGSTLTISAEP